MKKLLFVLLIYLAFSTTGISQGTIRGKVTDINGESLIGATVIIKENPSLGTITDFEGNYSIKADRSNLTLIVQYISYQTIEETVVVSGNKVVIRNFELAAATTELEDVVITAKANRSNDSYMQKVKLKSAISIDYISKETIRKIGDSRVDDAVKRVTGVSSIGGFITVRGLADRYVLTTLNGARIPTLDPLTNNIKLDLFPTALIDNLVITKTLSPDLPANWAGAYLSIETKDYPQKFQLNVKTSIGYNPQTTFNSIVSSKRSSTDWLGFDDGYREINHPGKENYTYYQDFPSMYNQFLALGLEEYIEELGINRLHLFEITGRYEDNIYYRLGLVELGLLPPGYIYNNSDVDIASDEYKNTLGKDAFKIINQPVEDFGTGLSEDWLTERRSASLDFSQDFTIGNQVSLFGRPLGIIAGFRYSNSVKNDPSSNLDSYDFNETRGGFFANTDIIRQSTIETDGWSALLNASYKISPNHSVSLTMMPNMIGINKARIDSGYSRSSDLAYEFLYVIRHDQRYEERQQLVYQLRSTHYFPMPKIKMDMVASYTDGKSSAPDYRKLNYGGIDTVNYITHKTEAVFSPDREFRFLDENILDVYLDAEIPLFERPGLSRKIKSGVSYFFKNRNNEQYLYYVGGARDNYVFEDIRDYLNHESFRINENQIGNLVIPLYYHYNSSAVDFNIGETSIAAAYAMTDFAVNQKFRIAGGVRFEHAEIFSDILAYHEAGYPAGDSARVFPSNSGPVSGLANKTADPAEFSGSDILPMVNLVYKIRENENILINARGNYSKSIVRPSVREVSPFWAYDYEQSSFLIGNPNLKPTDINNFDLRLETYFPSGSFLSLSLFYKDFTNHIELSREINLTWRNGETGTAMGIELEGKKIIARNLTIGANLTYVYSNTDLSLYDPEGRPTLIIERQMFGQAPYIINAMVNYTSDRLGLSATATYNVQGPKLAIASAFSLIPDIYELPRNLVDLNFSKSISEHFVIDFKIRNLLNAAITRSHDGDGDFYPSWSKDSNWDNLKYSIQGLFSEEKRYRWDFDYDSYRFGTTFVLGLAYNL